MRFMKREYYSDSIAAFLNTNHVEIIGQLVMNNDFPVEQTQRDAWLEEINILQSVLRSFHGAIYFEYSIPRMGQRIDVVLLIGPVIFVLEFKVGEREFTSHAVDQVWDYALDLKNFHETSHERFVAPILIRFIGFSTERRMCAPRIILKMLPRNFMCRGSNLIGHVLLGMLISGTQKVVGSIGLFAEIAGIIFVARSGKTISRMPIGFFSHALDKAW